MDSRFRWNDAPYLQSLPIDPLIPEIVEKLKAHQNLVLQSSPGSGKTTRVPPAILKSGLIKENQQIWILVPRRLAAKYAATRVAFELGEELGKTVGYQFKDEKVESKFTQIKFITEGLFPRLLLQDPKASKAAVIILDEFHERHLQSDIALNLAKDIQCYHRPDLKIICMSATIETSSLLKFLPNSHLIQFEQAPYPTQTTWLSKTSKASQDPLDKLVSKAVKEVLKNSSTKNILIFLPGRREIEQSANSLSNLNLDAEILPLYAELPKDKQALIFNETVDLLHKSANDSSSRRGGSKVPQSAEADEDTLDTATPKLRHAAIYARGLIKRKIILATNIAESSLTFPNVNMVIDSGLKREASFNWWSGLTKLETKNISQASAIQRAGRASRTEAGFCFRLYTEEQYKSWPPFDKADIEKSDLAQALLEIKKISSTTLDANFWYQEPPQQALQHACELLYFLKAFEEPHLNSQLTNTGKQMAKIPLAPRLSKLLLRANEVGIQKSAAHLAACLSENEFTCLDAFEFLEINSKRITNTRDQLLKLLPKQTENFQNREDEKTLLSRVILSAYPDHVAQVSFRENNKEKVCLNLCQGSSAYAALHPLFKENKYFILLDVQESRGQIFAKTLCPVDELELLEIESFAEEQSSVAWNSKESAVEEKHGLYYGKLTLEEKIQTPQNLLAAKTLLIEKLFQIKEKDKLDFHTFLELSKAWEDSSSHENLSSQLARLKLFLDTSKDHFSWEELLIIFEGVYKLKHLEEFSLEQRIFTLLDASQQRQINQQLPLYWISPNKRKFKIFYHLNQSPHIQAKLQEFWGISENISINFGKTPVVLHLLAPNQRPIQVTQNLKSFWENTYPSLKNQLSRRYPKHFWP